MTIVKLQIIMSTYQVDLVIAQILPSTFYQNQAFYIYHKS